MEGGYFISSIHDRHFVLSLHPLVRRESGEAMALLGELCNSKKDLTLPYLDNVLQGGPSTA